MIAHNPNFVSAGEPTNGFYKTREFFLSYYPTSPDSCEYIKYVNMCVLRNYGYLCDLSFMLLTLLS